MRTSFRRSTVAVAAVVVAVLLTATTAAADTAGHRHIPAGRQQIDLSGVTLHAGDQLNSLRTILHAAGEDQNVPYKIDWSTFIGGPAVLAAQTGGSVDVGFMAETPLVFAQAAGNPVKVVAVSRAQNPNASSYAVVVKPGSPIKKLSQLRGKKIAYSIGTITQYLLLNTLKKAGLSFHDVQAVNFTGLSGQTAFENGDVDAAVISDPFLSKYLLAGAARVLTTGAGLTPGFTYLVARDEALKDKRLNAALADFVGRVARAQKYWSTHPDQVAASNAANFKLTTAAALAAAKRSPSAYEAIDNTVVKAQQQESDAFLKLGAISVELDARKLFDTRYNKVVVAATGGSDRSHGSG